MAASGAFEFYYADFANGGPGRRNIYTSYNTWILSFALCIYLLYFDKYLTDRKERIEFIQRIMAIGFIFIMGYYTLLNDSSMYADNTVNLGAVLMPIINTYYGAIPPIDTQSQYGMYPLFILPILKIFGLNIFIISLIFAVLFVICLYGIYSYSKRMTNSRLLAVLVLISAFYLNTSFGNIWPAELYIQYRPIRMLAPCASLLLLLLYQKNCSIVYRYLTLILLSSLVIWNVDSGLPTIAAFLITIAINYYFATDRVDRLMGSIYFIIEGALLLLIVVLVFAIFCFVIKGEWITLRMFLEPQLIWRGNSLYFQGWNQPIILSTILYLIAISMAIARGFNNVWGNIEVGLLYIGLLGIGISTYGTLNPQSAAVTFYLLPIILCLFSLIVEIEELTSSSNFKSLYFRRLFRLIYLFPICFISISYGFHIKENYGYWGVATLFDVTYPSTENSKSLWPIPGKTMADTDYVKVKDLAQKNPIKPIWLQKSEWLKEFAYLKNPSNKVFIASMHDHYLYAAIEKKSPMRVVNFQHIPNYSQWDDLYGSVKSGKFDYIVIDEEYFLRNSDATGPDNYDRFIEFLPLKYSKLIEKNIGYDWHYPGWKVSAVSIWKVRGGGL